jgi:tetratricopeptide (TPR) repeat protein
MILPQVENYAAAPGMFKAQIADTSNPDLQYTSLLQQYRQGKKDPAFLRYLALMAARLKDTSNTAQISTTYINGMSDPFTYNNLKFILKFTKTTQDPGFEILRKNPEKIDQVLGPNKAISAVKSIIYNNEIKPLLSSKDADPNWNTLEKQIVTKYGAAGEEIMWFSKVMYSHEKKDWPTLVTTAKLLIGNYGKHLSASHLNSIAWDIFENVTDTTALQLALTWSKNAIEQQSITYYIDTYANLLYKLGHKEEAIIWEKKAMLLSPLEQGFRDTLEKMTKGEKTWK